MRSIDEGRQTEKNDWGEQAGFFHYSSKGSISIVGVFVPDDARGQSHVYNILYKVTTNEPNLTDLCVTHQIY